MKQNNVLHNQHKWNFRCFIVFICIIFFASQNAYAGNRLFMKGTETFIDKRAGLMWQFERGNRIKDLEEALQIVRELNKGQFSNWRFPNKDELQELFQVYDMKDNGDVKIRLEGNYWLVDKDEIKIGSWEIGDGCGPTRTFYFKKTGGYVRAVRSI